MKQIGVLIVDDSSVMRRSITLLLEKDPDFLIIGIARNGEDAIEKVQRLRPDVVTMDVEMPGMDGIEALKVIMATCPVPVVMLSNHTEEGAKTTIKALELGAADFFLKSALIDSAVSPETIETFINGLKAIVKGNNFKSNSKEKETVEKPLSVEAVRQGHSKIDALVIGCSTGGPSALQSVLPKFPKNLDIPVLVVQHMPPGFTGPLAERFNTLCQVPVKEAVDGELFQSGCIYIAPAGFQTFTRKRADGKVVISVDPNSPIETAYAPSVNVALLSTASVYKDKLMAVVMTGMGNDGLIGCQEVKRLRGKVITETEESCVVYGMPRVIYEAGLSDRHVHLSKIYDTIIQLLT